MASAPSRAPGGAQPAHAASATLPRARGTFRGCCSSSSSLSRSPSSLARAAVGFAAAAAAGAGAPAPPPPAASARQWSPARRPPCSPLLLRGAGRPLTAGAAAWARGRRRAAGERPLAAAAAGAGAAAAGAAAAGGFPGDPREPPSSSSSSSSSSLPPPPALGLRPPSPAAAGAGGHLHHRHHHDHRRGAALLPPSYALPHATWGRRRMVESGIVPVPHFGGGDAAGAAGAATGSSGSSGSGSSSGGSGSNTAAGGGPRRASKKGRSSSGGERGAAAAAPARRARAVATRAAVNGPAAGGSGSGSSSSGSSSNGGRRRRNTSRGGGGGGEGGGASSSSTTSTTSVAEPAPPTPLNGNSEAAAAGAAAAAAAPPAPPPPSTPTSTTTAATAAATAAAAAAAAAASGGLPRADHFKFVQFFRNASPYIAGHRGRTFVVVIPGEVVQQPQLLESIMADIALLHGLGVRIVLVIGAAPQIDAALRERGEAPVFAGGYRVTGAAALEAAVEAAGRARTAAEQYLSRGPSVPVFRRHAKGGGNGGGSGNNGNSNNGKDDDVVHFGPALSVVSGNCVAAKRRGVLDGVDYGYTGEVRFVAAAAIRRHLDDESIVLLSNLGFTSVGEVLNCNTYDVGLHAAVELGADKLICLHLQDVADLALPQWLPVSAARRMLLDRLLGQPPPLASMDTATADSLRLEALLQGAASGAAAGAAAGGKGGARRGGGRRRQQQQGGGSAAAADANKVVAASAASAAGGSSGRRVRRATGASSSSLDEDASPLPSAPGSEPPSPASPSDEGLGGRANHSGGGDVMLNLDVWQSQGFPTAASVAVVACCRGVKRAHLVDARVDGGVLLELYSRDGIGTMISTDFYEGIRRARPSDLDGLKALLGPLETAGVLVARSREDLRALLPHFTVLEREARAMGCVLLLPLGEAPLDGRRVAEIGAFCVDPAFRGSGRGDSLLDYAEQEARARGVQRLVLLTTRTADWFMARDFRLAGPAWSSELLPEARRARVDPSRNSQLYVKELVPLDDLDDDGGASGDDPLAAGGAPRRRINPEPGKRIGF